MPIGATHAKPILTDEEAWDVAAFVNTQPRPRHPFLQQDWPDISGKPYDHPFGPYADPYPETQHKYGPFGPIKKFKQAAKAQKEAADKVAKAAQKVLVQ
jgi:thiosulfate dehydrogenase